MKLKKKYKIMLSVLAIMITILIGIIIYKVLFFKEEKSENPITNISTITNKIEGYNYTLEDRDTELFNTLFQELKQNLENSEIDDIKYVQSIAKLFIVDIYTIQNKISKYDIGGLEYLYEGAKESFRAKILDSMYKTVEDDSYKTRKQELPIVKSIEAKEPQQTNYSMNGNTYDAYEVTLSWEYEKNLGYDTTGTLIIVKEENKWSIVSYKPGN